MKCITLTLLYILLLSTVNFAFASPPESMGIPITTTLNEIDMTKIIVKSDGCEVEFKPSDKKSGTLDFEHVPQVGEKTCQIYFCSAEPCGTHTPNDVYHQLKNLKMAHKK